MLIAASIAAALAALLHVYIFVMESVTWTSRKTRATFGLSVEEAESTREMAFNQGFYNLFLAIVTVVGLVLLAMAPGSALLAAGIALVFAGVGSMFAAALVLFVSSPGKRGAALKQGIIPLITLILLALAAVN